MNTNIYDIPPELLVEILCRLPCNKFVVQCKCVAKSWCTLLSEPSFICRFLWIQSDKQIPITRTIIDVDRQDLLTTDACARLRKSFSENPKARVLATWNDLVLCCKDVDDHRDYYICNPLTFQLVTLPPIPRCHSFHPLGFICEPYSNYKEEESDDSDQQKEERKVIKINSNYRCRVVRILPPDNRKETCFKFNIQVFSSETGEWRESVAPCPQGFEYYFQSEVGYASNGMLYWNSYGDILGLGPFMINNATSTSSGIGTNGDDIVDHYQFHVIKFDQPPGMYRFAEVAIFGVYQGCLRLYDYDHSKEIPRLYVWELKKEELEQMAVDGGGKLSLKHLTSYLLDPEMIHEDAAMVSYLGFDPNDLDIIYVDVDDTIYKCNICTGGWSEIDVKKFHGSPFQLVLPWWPTPVPRMIQRAHLLT
ncbi:hypothetical protein M0R45_026004 [Rubus argutus]|uniref:F-box domain-containing protein n=1 Tax=Rubus argutus TaxID=59490 RepID=A0AAW1WWY1_RUBAR